eukprot:1661107-Prymnesium_polylepis.2
MASVGFAIVSIPQKKGRSGGRALALQAPTRESACRADALSSESHTTLSVWIGTRPSAPYTSLL